MPIEYTCTYTCTMVRTMVHVYHTNITFSLKRLEIQALRCNGDTINSGRCQHRRHHGTRVLVRTRVVPWYLVDTCTSTRVPWYHGTMVLEYHGRLQLRFQLDSDVCSADLHHNPRKHVGLHAHQRLYHGSVLPR